MVYCSITARHVVNHFSSIEAQWQIDSVKYSGNAFWVFVIFFYYIWRVVWSIKFDNRRYLCDNNNIVRKEDRFYEIVFFFLLDGPWDTFYFISPDRKSNFLYHTKLCNIPSSTSVYHWKCFLFFMQSYTRKNEQSTIKHEKLNQLNYIMRINLKKIFLFIATKCGVLLVLCNVK